MGERTRDQVIRDQIKVEQFRLIREHADKSLVSVQLPAGLVARLDHFSDLIWPPERKKSRLSRNEFLESIVEDFVVKEMSALIADMEIYSGYAKLLMMDNDHTKQ